MILSYEYFCSQLWTKNTTDFDKHTCFGYGIGFNAYGSFSLSDGSGFGKNVITFTVDTS